MKPPVLKVRKQKGDTDNIGLQLSKGDGRATVIY